MTATDCSPCIDYRYNVQKYLNCCTVKWSSFIVRMCCFRCT